MLTEKALLLRFFSRAQPPFFMVLQALSWKPNSLFPDVTPGRLADSFFLFPQSYAPGRRLMQMHVLAGEFNLFLLRVVYVSSSSIRESNSSTSIAVTNP